MYVTALVFGYRLIKAAPCEMCISFISFRRSASANEARAAHLKCLAA